MMSIKEAQKLGINACINKLGRDFVLTFRETSSASYATAPDDDGNVFCFVGVDNRSYDYTKRRDVLTLDSTSQFPYRVSCNVNINSESVIFTECVLPA